jgi:hypothetical protein
VVSGRVLTIAAASVFVAPVLAGQAKPKEAKEEPEIVIPESAWPPEGMCRVWLRDVPERQQPAPTDCATALRSRPRDAKILMGEPAKDARQLFLPYATSSLRSSVFDGANGRGIRSMNASGRDDRFVAGRPVGSMSPSEAARAAEAALAAQRAGQGATQVGGQAALKTAPIKPDAKPPEPPPQH